MADAILDPALFRPEMLSQTSSLDVVPQEKNKLVCLKSCVCVTAMGGACVALVLKRVGCEGVVGALFQVSGSPVVR